jgi:ubiquitin C-terminal hydrolase
MDLTPKVGKCGFVNIGNTCYMNSILQLLLHCRSINNFLLNNCLLDEESGRIYNEYLFKNISKRIKNKKEIIRVKKNIDISTKATTGEIREEMEKTITFNLSELINVLVDKGSATITPNKFKNIIGLKIPDFRGNGQQDAHELLIKILDSIYEECGIPAHIRINNTCNNIKIYSELLEQYNALTNEENKNRIGLEITRLIKNNTVEFKKYNGLYFIGQTFKNKYNPISNDIFIFQINTIKCQDCNNETYNYDYTSIISLEPKNTLLESFEDYCSFKLTDENYKCMACGANKPAYKLCKIYKHSPIIFIHLKRFKFNGRGYSKDNNNVEIPNNINIENYCDTDINKVKSKYYNYSLSGISNHMGSLDGGHYTSDCKDLVDNEWYHFDDSRVYKYNNSNIDKSNSYILMYEIN